jgi:hypothetical protein
MRKIEEYTMFINKNEEKIANELKLWNKVCNVKIKTAYNFKLENSYTTEEFQAVISEYFSPDTVSFYIDEHNKLVIINTETHSVILSINGHIAGDTYGGWEIYFVPDIMNTNHGSYYKKEYLGRLRDYTFDNESLFIVNDKMLMKYSKEGTVLWEANLIIEGGRQTTQGLYFNHTHRYPDKSYPNNLIAISDCFNLFYYYKDSGIYYGERKLVVK